MAISHAPGDISRCIPIGRPIMEKRVTKTI